MMLDRPFAFELHSAISAAVPYLYNGTPLAFDVLAHQATIIAINSKLESSLKFKL